MAISQRNHRVKIGQGSRIVYGFGGQSLKFMLKVAYQRLIWGPYTKVAKRAGSSGHK